jgi:hypothetical protein
MTAWILNTASIFITTIGVLLIFLYLWKAPRFAVEALPPDDKRAYEKHHRGLVIGVGLLAAWLLVQDIAILVL